METEKVNTGGQDAQKSEFMKRIEAKAAEMRDLAQEDAERREVFLVACDHHTVARLLVGGEKDLPLSVALAMMGDEEGTEVMMKIFMKWLELLDVKTAVAVARALYETVKQKLKEEESRPKAEA